MELCPECKTGIIVTEFDGTKVCGRCGTPLIIAKQREREYQEWKEKRKSLISLDQKEEREREQLPDPINYFKDPKVKESWDRHHRKLHEKMAALDQKERL